MAEYRKKPVVVEAWPVRELNHSAERAWAELPESVRADYALPQGDGGWVFGALVERSSCPRNADHVIESKDWRYCPTCGAQVEKTSRRGIYVPTLEGNLFADADDWIICGVEGEFYPVKPSVFKATYDPVA